MVFGKIRGMKLEQVLIAIIGVVVISSGIVILLVQDSSYRQGLNERRLYKEKYGEFFTLSDSSLDNYIDINAVFKYVTYFQIDEENSTTIDERYSPYSDLESRFMYKLAVDFANKTDIEPDVVELGEYECNKITIRSSTNHTGHYILWIWDYHYKELIYVFKMKYDGFISPVIDITRFVVYDNNRHIKNVIIEGLFIPSDLRS